MEGGERNLYYILYFFWKTSKNILLHRRFFQFPSSRARSAHYYCFFFKIAFLDHFIFRNLHQNGQKNAQKFFSPKSSFFDHFLAETGAQTRNKKLLKINAAKFTFCRIQSKKYLLNRGNEYFGQIQGSHFSRKKRRYSARCEDWELNNFRCSEPCGSILVNGQLCLSFCDQYLNIFAICHIAMCSGPSSGKMFKNCGFFSGPGTGERSWQMGRYGKWGHGGIRGTIRHAPGGYADRIRRAFGACTGGGSQGCCVRRRLTAGRQGALHKQVPPKYVPLFIPPPHVPLLAILPTQVDFSMFRTWKVQPQHTFEKDRASASHQQG